MSYSELGEYRARRIAKSETKLNTETTTGPLNPELYSRYVELDKLDSLDFSTIIYALERLKSNCDIKSEKNKNERKILEERVTELKEKIDRYRELKESLTKDRDSLKRSNESLSMQLNTKSIELERKNERVESLEAKVNKKEKIISEKEAIIRERDKQLADTEEKLNKLRDDYGNSKNRYESDLEISRRDRSQLENQLENTKKKLKETEDSLEEERRVLEKTKSQLDEYIQDTQKLNNTLKEREDSIEKLSVQLKEKEDECARKQSDIDKLETVQENLNAKLNKIRADLSKKEEYLSSQQASCKQLEEELEEKRDKIEEREKKISELKIEVKNKDKKISNYKLLCGTCVLKGKSDYEWLNKEENILRLVNIFETLNRDSFITNITTNRAKEEITATVSLSGDEVKYLVLSINKDSYKCVLQTIDSNRGILETKSISESSFKELLDALRDEWGFIIDYTPLDESNKYDIEDTIEDNIVRSYVYEPYKKLKVFSGYNFYETQSIFKKIFGDKYKFVQNTENLFNSEERTYECVIPGRFEDIIGIHMEGADGKSVSLSLNGSHESKYTRVHCETVESLEELLDNFRIDSSRTLKTTLILNKATEKFFDMFKKKGIFKPYKEKDGYNVFRCFKLDPYLETPNSLELKVNDSSFTIYFNGSSIAGYSIDSNLEGNIVSFATSQKHIINSFKDYEKDGELRNKYIPNYKNRVDPAGYTFPSNDVIKNYRRELRTAFGQYIEAFENRDYNKRDIIGIIGKAIKEGISIAEEWKNKKFGNLESGDEATIVEYERTREQWSYNSKKIISELSDKCYAAVCRSEEERYVDFPWADFRTNCIGRIINYALAVLMNRGNWSFDVYDLRSHSVKFPSVLDSNNRKCIDCIRVE